MLTEKIRCKREFSSYLALNLILRMRMWKTNKKLNNLPKGLWFVSGKPGL